MAKSRKPKGFSDPLDSIFGFIFTGAKSKPVKTRPTRFTGVNATEMLSQGLAEIASKPANYVSSALMEPVNQLANGVKISEFHLDRFDDSLLKNLDNSAGRFRIRGGDLAKFMKDPNKFVDSVFQGAAEERKWARYLNIGRGMDTALLTAWAKKQGFSSKDALQIGLATSNFLGPDQTLEAKKKQAQNSVLRYLDSRSGTSKVSKTISSQTLEALEKYKGAGFRSEAELEKVLRTVPGLATRSDFSTIVTEIFDGYADEAYGKKDATTGERKGGKWNSIGGGWLTDGKLNRNGYISVLNDNYLQRASLLDATDPHQALEQRRLLAARQSLSTLLRLKGPSFNPIEASATFGSQIDSINKEIEKMKARAGTAGLNARQKIYASNLEGIAKQIEAAIAEGDKAAQRKMQRRWFGFQPVGDFSAYRKAMVADVDLEIERAGWQAISPGLSASKKEYYKNLIASLMQRKKELRSAPLRDWRIIIADTVGAYRSIDGNIRQGGLAGGIISGSIFTNDYFSPAQGQKFIVKRFEKSTFGKVWENEVPVMRGDINQNYASMTSLYYFTPGSLAKTFFFNGEGFSRLLLRQRVNNLNSILTPSALSSLNGFLNASPSLLASLTSAGWAKGGKVNLDVGSLVYDLPGFMSAVEKGGGAKALGPLWGQLTKVYNTDQNGPVAQALRFFGTPQRNLVKVATWYEATFRKPFGQFLHTKVYPKILGRKFAEKIALTGSIKAAISAIVTDALVALGVSIGGPIGAVAAFIVTFVVEDVLLKIAKPLVKLFFLVLWSTVLVIVAFIGFVLIIWPSTYPLPQQHKPPLDAMACGGGNPFSGLYNFQTVQASNIPDAPPGSTCPILSPSMLCSQGSGPGSSSYHSARQSLDISARGLADTVWYAPTNGTVVSFSARNICNDGADYGGALVFRDSAGTTYTLLHVKALASGPVSKGKPVAIIQTDLIPSDCWTGPHFHLDVQTGGGFVNTETWYREKLKCNITKAAPSCNG
ncbi:hypothetical protein IT417_01790 [bacterium]|nr:hypothetical protein [bacterium]